MDIYSFFYVGLGLVLGIFISRWTKSVPHMSSCKGRKGYLILADSADKGTNAGYACDKGRFYAVVEDLNTHKVFTVWSPHPIEGKGNVFTVIYSDDELQYRWHGATSRPKSTGKV